MKLLPQGANMYFNQIPNLVRHIHTIGIMFDL